MSRQDELSELIDLKNKRLHELKKQEAVFGFGTDPAISVEMNKIQAELENLRQELAEMGSEVAPSLLSPAGSQETVPQPGSGETIQADFETDSLDDRIMLILYAYFKRYPGNPRMSFKELVIACRVEREEVIAELMQMEERGWINAQLLDQAGSGMVWLTAAGIKVAKGLS